jgi:hypothetical protein
MLGPAYAGSTNGVDANNARPFLDHARTDALRLGLVSPRFALGEEIADAATSEEAESCKVD